MQGEKHSTCFAQLNLAKLQNMEEAGPGVFHGAAENPQAVSQNVIHSIGQKRETRLVAKGARKTALGN